MVSEMEKFKVTKKNEFDDFTKSGAKKRHKTGKEIPYMFNSIDWKTGVTCQLRISHIYDPFKFWVVIKYRELDLFQSYLHHIYNTNPNQHRIPVKHLRLHMHCIAYTNNTFYRAKIINFPFTSSFTQEAQIYLMDFGYICVIPCTDLLAMQDSMYTVPQFAIRASLVVKLDKNAHKSTWPDSAVKKFQSLTSNQIINSKIVSICEERMILYLKLGLFDHDRNFLDVGNEILADSSPPKTENTNYIVKVDCLRALPPFELIESGRVPPSHETSQMLMQTMPLDVAFRDYYEYKT